MKPQSFKSWKALTRLASDHVQNRSQPAQEEPDGDLLRLQAAGLYLDFSKHRLGTAVLNTLLDLAHEAKLAERIEDLFQGAVVNQSEGRAALHTALRAPADEQPEIARASTQEMERVLALAEAVRTGAWRGYTGKTITDVVHIGIGGSHFGPELAVDALQGHDQAGPRIRFLANIDPEAVRRALQDLNPERTLIIVASKSFTTLETRINAETARSWFLERTTRIDAIASHFVAISTNLEAAREFGIAADNVFAMWDWIGGRYSVWSPVGLPLALAIGAVGFREFQQGAHALDQHFRTTSFDANLPVLMALIGIWNYNFLGITNQAVLPYSERLRLLPDFLQQLTMESNGKGVHADGSPIGIHTMPVVWGGRGTNGQHAFHQLLHQGTRSFAADFVVVVDGPEPQRHQHWLLANALAQSQAMLLGHEDADPHRQVPGNKGTTTIVMDALTPATLGALLALYEQVVFCQGVLWNINSFDQWGVELGKQLAIPIHEQLNGKSAIRQDPSTRALIGRLLNSQKTPEDD